MYNLDDVPANMRDLAEDIGTEMITCKSCQMFATTFTNCNHDGYNTGECVSIECGRNNKCQTWGYCFTCRKRLGYNAIKSHAASQSHKKKSGQTINVRKKRKTQDTVDAASVPNEADFNFEDDNLMTFPNDDDIASVAGMSTSGFLESMDQEMEDVSTTGTISFTEDEAKLAEDETIRRIVLQQPELMLDGSKWLADLLKDTQRASVSEVHESLAGLDSMCSFWVSEHASPSGRAGGGIRFLVAKTFQKVGNFLDKDKYPTYPEALWHIESFIQYQSQTEKQRQRQARITQSYIGHLQQHFGGEALFKNTFIPDYKDVHKIYGTQAQQSLWNLLPIPPIQDIHGVAYVSPIHIAKFIMANGLPINDFFIQFLDEDRRFQDEDFDNQRLVSHISESRRAFLWKKELVLRQKERFREQKFAINMWFSDWVDGFGPSRTKNNRGSVDLWSGSFAPRKSAVNSTDNTFVIAIGLKKAKGWPEVARRIRNDFRQLSCMDRPTMMYHGILRKMVPVFFKQFASIEDKAERPDTTGTLGSGSGLHRRFGYIGRLDTPTCKVDELEAYLENQRNSTVPPSCWGWSQYFVEDGCNGSKLPACLQCRRNRLVKLGTLKDPQNNVTDCKNCCDWELLGRNSSLLSYAPGQEYPKLVHDDCPVEAPPGREVNQKELLPVKLGFQMMKQACRFAFFHCSRPRGTSNWTKATCKEYLRNCGLATKDQEQLYETAKNARNVGMHVNYQDDERVGNFLFHPAWSGEIELEDYIEAVMHLLHLGIAEDIMELGTEWMKASRQKNVSSSAFRKAVQPLLRELKKFQLSWLMIFPFTGEENDLKTGGWVAENWAAFVRVSPILFAWACREDENPSEDAHVPKNQTAVQDGFRDLARVIISFHAVVARVQTHSGINQEFISETELYIKEFLSSVRELDVRLRYKVLRKESAVGKKKKKTGAFFLKSNFMSLLNLPPTMSKLGPMVLWMDGGGKGERFIQEVKPHIKRGVREDAQSFFNILTGKVYKMRQIKYIEQRYCLNVETNKDKHEAGSNLVDLLEAVKISEDSHSENAEENDDSDVDNEDAERDLTVKQLTESVVSKVEEEGMWKKSTIFIYRNERDLQAAIEGFKPIAGILQENTARHDDGEATFDFFAVCRKPVKEFACRKVFFDDSEGVAFHGMWYSPMKVDEELVQVSRELDSIKQHAKFSVVAIPLRYIVGEDKADSQKYCVISNWWKTRNKDGEYNLPGLDSSLYDENLDSEVANNPNAF